VIEVVSPLQEKEQESMHKPFSLFVKSKSGLPAPFIVLPIRRLPIRISQRHRGMSSSIPASRIPRYPSPRRINLVLDFDGTLTVSDTLSLVAHIGYQKRRNASPPVPPWSSIVSAYLFDLSAHTSSYPHPPASRITFDAERDWLNSLLPIERASAQRAIDAGIWDGVTVQDVERVATEAVKAGDVKLREGWGSLLSIVGGQRKAQGKLNVLSVNWSRCWIMSVIDASLESRIPPSQKTGLEAALAETEVFANELPSIAATVEAANSVKKFTRKRVVEIRTSGDKVEMMRELRSSHAELVVYVGDSATDLQCLLDADIGICIRDEKMGSTQRELAETMERIGEEVTHIADEIGAQEEYGYYQKRVFWARGFGEIEAFLKRVQNGRINT
jgi:phosphoglycolate phosphatase-like HAD superfamily hydrolase